MTNEIINLLPCQKLKNKIRETRHVFTDTELLYIISMYAPTFDKKLEMLSRFAKTASPEVAAAAQKFIEYYKNHRDAFFGNSKNAVYRVKIWRQTVPGDFHEVEDFDFLASSYKAALKGIDRYYREYEEAEINSARYKIVKKHLFTGDESEDDEFPDYLGECWLGAGKVLLEVDDESVPYDFSDDAGSISPHNAYDLEVPNFICNRDAVIYEIGNKTLKFGVILEHTPEPLSNFLYAVPLDSEHFRINNFAEAWRNHSHPYAHGVKLISPDELPFDIRKNYFAYMKYLDENHEA